MPPMFSTLSDDFYRETVPFYGDKFPVPASWYKDIRRHRKVKASKPAFIWPKDGRNGTKWGRMKDVLTNKGPDIHVVGAARKGGWFANRPTRAQWSHHTDLVPSPRNQLNSKKYAPWTANGMLGGRQPGLSYDFRTRKFSPKHESMWTDAVWQPESHTNSRLDNYPKAFRDIGGFWWWEDQYLFGVQDYPVGSGYGLGDWTWGQ